MTEQIRKLFSGIAVPLCLLIYICVDVSGQKTNDTIRKCKVTAEDVAKYNLVAGMRTAVKPEILVLRIVLKDRDFNEVFMKRLVNTLRAEYCHEKVMSVIIFDSKKDALRTDVVQYVVGNEAAPQIRGAYAFDSERKSEVIAFSRRRGNPHNEVVLRIH